MFLAFSGVCRVSLSCKCTDGLVSQYCEVFSYFKRFSLAKTWVDVKQQISQTPNLFSSLKKEKILCSETTGNPEPLSSSSSSTSSSSSS